MRRTKIRMTTEFSLETVHTRSQSNNIVRSTEGIKTPRILYPEKIYYKTNGKLKKNFQENTV